MNIGDWSRGTGTRWNREAAPARRCSKLATLGAVAALALSLATPSTSFAANAVVKSTQWHKAASGTAHTLAVAPDGSLYSWGDNARGQLGDGNVVDVTTPHKVAAGTTWGSVAAGDVHSLALRTDGTLFAWGGNGYGQLGNGSTAQSNTPVQIGTAKWKSVAAGGLYSLGIQTNGGLYAWGNNNCGQLGDGTTVSHPAPVRIGTASDWVAVSAGSGGHVLALKNNGTLWAWGNNEYGQLGNGGTIDSLRPVQVGTDSDWVQASVGNGFSVARKANGVVYAWGANGYGQCGDGTGSRSLPARISGTNKFIDISTGYSNTIARKADGTVYAWGRNANGQCGNTIGGSVFAPTQVSGLTGSVALGTSVGYHWVVVTGDGAFNTFGENGSGQLGDGALVDDAVPASVLKPAAKYVSMAGGDRHALALMSNGTVSAWGDGEGLQVPYVSGSSLGDHVCVTGQGWKAIAAGSYHNAAIKSDGTLWTWGDNSLGQLGDAQLGGRDWPVPVGVDRDWVAVSAAKNYTLALKADGSLWGWGSNTSSSLYHAPIQIGSDTDWVAVDARGCIPTAMKANGRFYELGTYLTPWTCPVENWAVDTYKIAYAYRSQFRFEPATGTLSGWGENTRGELGLGDRISRSSWTVVGTSTAWTTVAAGDQFTMAISGNGDLYAWGANESGQLGDRTLVDRYTPVQSY